jgi:hypothetical protein
VEGRVESVAAIINWPDREPIRHWARKRRQVLVAHESQIVRRGASLECRSSAFTCRQRCRSSGSLASELRGPSCERDSAGGGSTAFPRPRRAGSTPELSGAAAFIRDEVAEEPQERNQVVADKTQADDD